MEMFVIYFLIQLVFISSIEIENFQNVTYPVGISEFTYLSKFSKPKDRKFITFLNDFEPYKYNIKDFKSTIVSLDEISRNIIRIKFEADSNLIKYYIVIAKKDEYNNITTFSAQSYVTKLMTNNSNLIIVKTINESTFNPVIITDINISNLNINENEELVVVIINEILNSDKIYNFGNFGTPAEYKLILKEPIEAKPWYYYDLNKTETNFFKFDYIHESDIDQFAVFKSTEHALFIFNEINQTEYTVFNFKEELAITLNKSGTFYFDFYPNYAANFYYYITGKRIGTIDLSQKLYSHEGNTRQFDSKYNPEKYLVNNLQKNTYAFFIFKVGDLPYSFENPFVICNNKNECEENVIIYNFLKGMTYTIYINFVKFGHYYLPSSFIFPIFEDTIEEKETGYYFISEPKIFITDITKKIK